MVRNEKRGRKAIFPVSRSDLTYLMKSMRRTIALIARRQVQKNNRFINNNEGDIAENEI